MISSNKTFNTSTAAAGNTVTVPHGLGVTPKAAWLYANGRTEGANTTNRLDHRRSFGATTGASENWSAASASNDNITVTTASGKRHVNDNCLCICTGSGAIDGLLALQSWDATNAVFIINDQFTASFTVEITFWAGADITNVKAFSFTQQTGTGTQDINVGFDVDFCLFAGIGWVSGSLSLDDSTICFGVGKSSTKRGVWLGGSQDNIALGTSIARSYCYGSECLAMFDTSVGTNLIDRADYNGKITNGLRLNWLENAGTAKVWFGLAFAGGSWSVESFITPSLEFYAGFETGDTSEVQTSGTGISVVTSPAYSGTYALKMLSRASGSTCNSASGILGGTIGYFKAAIRVDVISNPSGTTKRDNIFFQSTIGNIFAIQVEVNTSGVIKLGMSNNGTQLGSQVTINNQQWYVVELYLKISTTVGEMTWWLDGTQKQASTSLNTGTGTIQFIVTSSSANADNDVTFYFDEIGVDSAARVSTDIVVTPGFQAIGGLAISAFKAQDTQDTASFQDRLSVGMFSSPSSRSAMGMVERHSVTTTAVVCSVLFDAVMARVGAISSIEGAIDVKAVGATTVTFTPDILKDTTVCFGLLITWKTGLQTFPYVGGGAFNFAGAAATLGLGTHVFTYTPNFPGQITLQWNANTEPDLAGYRIKYGTVSGVYPNIIDVGNVTIYTVTGLTRGVPYFFVIVAYDSVGNESAPSTEIMATPTEGGMEFGGAAVTQYAAFAQGLFSYTASGELDFVGGANLAKVKAYDAGGGLLFAGAADLAKAKNFTPSGELDFAGTAVTGTALSGLFTYQASGSLQFDGIVSLVKVKAYLASGELDFVGLADISKIRGYIPIGIPLTFNGAALTESSGPPSPVTLTYRSFFGAKDLRIVTGLEWNTWSEEKRTTEIQNWEEESAR